MRRAVCSRKGIGSRVLKRFTESPALRRLRGSRVATESNASRE